MWSTSRPAVATIAVAVALVVASCGGDDDEPESAPVVTTETGQGVTSGSTVSADASSTVPADRESPDDQTGPGSDEELFPDVLSATAERGADGTFAFSATLSSPYDSPERYADAWRILAPDGSVLGIRELTHDHAAEQPFTRSLSGVAVPEDVDEVIVEGRDQLSGWGGRTVTIIVER